MLLTFVCAHVYVTHANSHCCRVSFINHLTHAHTMHIIALLPLGNHLLHNLRLLVAAIHCHCIEVVAVLHSVICCKLAAICCPWGGCHMPYSVSCCKVAAMCCHWGGCCHVPYSAICGTVPLWVATEGPQLHAVQCNLLYSCHNVLPLRWLQLHAIQFYLLYSCCNVFTAAHPTVLLVVQLQQCVATRMPYSSQDTQSILIQNLSCSPGLSNPTDSPSLSLHLICTGIHRQVWHPLPARG